MAEDNPFSLGDLFSRALVDMPIQRIRPPGLDVLGAGVGGPSRVPMMPETQITLSHGSPRSGIQILVPSVRGPLGPGVYASDNGNVFSRYGSNTYSFEVPAGSIFHGLGSRSMGDIYPNRSPYDVWRSQGERLAQVAGDRGPQVRNLFDKRWPEEGYQTFGDLSQMFGGDPAAQLLYRRAGFKGLSGHVDGPEYVLFDPVGVGSR